MRRVAKQFVSMVSLGALHSLALLRKATRHGAVGIHQAENIHPELPHYLCIHLKKHVFFRTVESGGSDEQRPSSLNVFPLRSLYFHPYQKRSDCEYNDYVTFTCCIVTTAMASVYTWLWRNVFNFVCFTISQLCIRESIDNVVRQYYNYIYVKLQIQF
jgi:hypothetical protein